MKSKRLIITSFIFSMMLSSELFAVMKKGEKNIHFGINYSWSKKLWKGPDSGKIDFGGDGKVTFLHKVLDYSHGVSNEVQLDVGTAFSESKMKSGSEGGSTAGDKVSGLNYFKVGLLYKLLEKDSYSVDSGLHLKLPFNAGQSSDYDESPDTFIAINDGASHLSFSFRFKYKIKSKFHLLANVSYSVRNDDLPDQIFADIRLPYYISDSWQIGLGSSYLQTLGGLDIGSSEFSRQVSIRSGGNSKVKAFSRVKEEAKGVSIFSAYKHNKNYSFYGYLHKKLKGRNTDVATSTGIGLNYSF